eukprot:389023_1
MISLLFSTIGQLVLCTCANAAVQSQNQLTDEKADKINKSYLPLPAGHISRHRLAIFSTLCYNICFVIIVCYWGIHAIQSKRAIALIVLATLYSRIPFTTFHFKNIPIIN